MINNFNSLDRFVPNSSASDTHKSMPVSLADSLLPFNKANSEFALLLGDSLKAQSAQEIGNDILVQKENLSTQDKDYCSSELSVENKNNLEDVSTEESFEQKIEDESDDNKEKLETSEQKKETIAFDKSKNKPLEKNSILKNTEKKEILTKENKKQNSEEKILVKGLHNVGEIFSQNTLSNKKIDNIENTKLSKSIGKGFLLHKSIEAASTAEIKDEKLLLLSNKNAIKKLIQDVFSNENSRQPYLKDEKEINLKNFLQDRLISDSGKKIKLKNSVKEKNSVRNILSKSPVINSEQAINFSENLVSIEKQNYPNGLRLNVSRETLLNRQAQSLAASQAESSSDRGSQHNSQNSFLGQNFNQQNLSQLGGLKSFGTASEILRSPSTQQQFQALLQRAQLNLKENGNARFTTKMYPAELGKVSVYLALNDGVVSGRFTVENDLVRAQLLEQLQQLSENLRQDGLDIQGFEVSVQDDSAHAKRGEDEKNQESSFLQSGINKAQEELSEQQKVIDSKTPSGEIYA